MATFLPFLDTTAVVRAAAEDVLITLPDPPRAPGDPIVRVGVARFAGASLLMLPLAPAAGGQVTVSSPVTGPCRRVDLTAPIPGLPLVSNLIEIAPLPFAIAGPLRALPGLPTFYLAGSGAVTPPPDDELVEGGEELFTASAVWFGALFDDRVTLSPVAVVRLIADAMTGVDAQADVDAWRAQDSLNPPGRTVRVLDHAGRPAAGYRMRLTGPAGTTTVAADSTGGISMPPGAVSLRWVEDDLGALPGRPLHALYETAFADADDVATSTPLGAALEVPPGLGAAHVQLLDADAWFADRPPGLDAELGHVRARSRLEPLVDGLAVFRLMLEDLRAATGPGNGAHFAGWAFNDFPLDLNDPDGTMFTDLVRALTQGGPDEAAGARFLMDKFLVFRDDATIDDMQRIAVMLIVAGGDALAVARIMRLVTSDTRPFVALGMIAFLAVLAATPFSSTILEKLEDAIDHSEEMAALLGQIHDGIALRSRHPGRFVDNPLVLPNPLADLGPFSLEPADLIDGTSSWHQKFQVIRRSPDALGNGVVGYVGGIDMNQNRLDSPGHHGSAWRPADEIALAPAPSPRAFHDVHARITGPAAADVALSFQRRWELDTDLQPPRQPGDPDLLDPAFLAPAADDPAVPPQQARHLVQICRSGYTPDPSGGSVALPWSRQGEGTISQALIKAIGAAEEYICIEDQYFTPHDAYVDALLDAALRAPRLRLLIVMPSASDQVFGDIRHQQIFDILRAGRPGEGGGFGDRLLIGAPVRRPVLGDAGRVASQGRAVLQEALTATGDQVLLGPRARLPEVGALSPFTPFWLWVQGERMLAAEQRDDVLSASGVPSRRFLVLRGGGALPRWGGTPRDHAQGAPVTLAQITGIYVHTKAIMIDDIFVGIGSCNTNRRGFFHDGEIQAFAVPERLKAARENPALALRTALWAEHLGLPPAMGRTLLADPISGFELFRRPAFVGNRLSGYDALGVRTDLAFLGEKVVWAETVATLGFLLSDAANDDLVPYLWNTFIEPTTRTEPPPRTPGPDL
jgi:phosphatidylserine/phosphatidylglycerophosphate/cardiolipin synthase-like enzyme